MLQYTWAYIVFGKSCLSSCRTLWVCFSLFSYFFSLSSVDVSVHFIYLFFIGVLPALCISAGWLQCFFFFFKCCLFLPWDPAGSPTIIVQSLNEPADREIRLRKKKQKNPSTKSNNHRDDSFDYFYDADFLQGSYSVLRQLVCFPWVRLCFYFLSKKKE